MTFSSKTYFSSAWHLVPCVLSVSSCSLPELSVVSDLQSEPVVHLE